MELRSPELSVPGPGVRTGADEPFGARGQPATIRGMSATDGAANRSSALPNVGCVVIGRNEGDRLKRCLGSITSQVRHVVYVDSGSTDGSAEYARSQGVDVVLLDVSQPFTAARARNQGCERVVAIQPDVEMVQFVDGDCEVAPGWLPVACARLLQHPELAVVCGRVRERFPERSPYNRLCDIEWDTPVGDTEACGGIAMIRLRGFAEVGGFDPTLIAGEEPELCLRLRRRGDRIERLDAEMCLHDAAITRFPQWWRRAVRGGYAYAEGAHLHGAPPERFCVRECRRAWFWGAIVPAVALLGAIPSHGWSLVALGGYPVTMARVFRHFRRRGRSRSDAAVASVFLTLGKFAELQGMLKFHWGRLRGRPSGLIEHKGRA